MKKVHEVTRIPKSGNKELQFLVFSTGRNGKICKCQMLWSLHVIASIEFFIKGKFHLKQIVKPNRKKYITKPLFKVDLKFGLIVCFSWAFIKLCGKQKFTSIFIKGRKGKKSGLTFILQTRKLTQKGKCLDKDRTESVLGAGAWPCLVPGASPYPVGTHTPL